MRRCMGCFPCFRQRSTILDALEQGQGPGSDCEMPLRTGTSPCGNNDEPLLLGRLPSPIGGRRVPPAPPAVPVSDSVQYSEMPTPLATPLPTPAGTTNGCVLRQLLGNACDTSPRPLAHEESGLQSSCSFVSAMSEPSRGNTPRLAAMPVPSGPLPARATASGSRADRTPGHHVAPPRRRGSSTKKRGRAPSQGGDSALSRSLSRLSASMSRLTDHLHPAADLPYAVHPPPPRTSPPRCIPDDLAAAMAPTVKCAPKLLSVWQFLGDPANVDHLRAGGALYAFHCGGGPTLTEVQREMVDSCVNLSSFDPLPHEEVCAASPEFIFILNKAVYLFPAYVHAELFTPEFVSSVEYQKRCQPGNPKIWTDCQEPDVFRFTKTIIPFVYKITIQFRVSALPRHQLHSLSLALCEGLPLCRGLLLERTKRDKSHTDTTRCVKSLLLYHELRGGGLMVFSVTTVVNTSLPNIAARVVDNFGGSGAQEVAETADNTRKYLRGIL
eukprot:TRINITY_DN12746_c0_g1_i1.p1 TRINITY_DN12746_c0_g1~~TRINITY_DN12746_c0_g1_i1.p1  ORF type:complete len:531 (+),score=161.14 TRINITY_DN12746_c0_g1_i1:105-1595(+)